jgi:hypothetical protein
MAGQLGRPETTQNAASMRSLAIVAAIAGVLLAIAGCGEKSEPDLADLPPPTTTAATTTVPGTTTSTTTTGPTKPQHPATPAASVRAYVAALSAGDGARVCARLAPGAIDELKLPKPNPKCDVALDRSIGYHDPKGPPAFKSATVRRVKIQQKGSRAKVVATVISRYVSERRPSTDDDIIYLKKSRAGWLILQPSAILYRAVGLEPPLSALKPPAGFEAGLGT